MKNERVKYIDIINGIGIILVLLSITGSLSSECNKVIQVLCPGIIYAGFGALYSRKELRKMPIEKVIGKGFFSVFIPYIISGLVVCATESIRILFINKDASANDLMDKLTATFSLRGVYYLGFLSSFFIGISLYTLIRKKCNLTITAIIAVAFIAYVIYISSDMTIFVDTDNRMKNIVLGLCFTLLRSILGFAFITLGEIVDGISVKASKRKLLCAAVGILLLISSIVMATREQYLDTLFFVLGTKVWYFAASITGVSAILLIANWIGESRPLEYVGRHAKTIFIAFYIAGILELQNMAQYRVFYKFDNHFARRATAVIVTIALEAICILVCNAVFGNKDKDNKR